MKIKKINSFVIQRSRYPALCFPNFFNMIKLTTKEFEDEFGCKLSYTAVLFRNNKRMFFIGEQEDKYKVWAWDLKQSSDVCEENPNSNLVASASCTGFLVSSQ